jgi:hypothetical protein
VRGQGFFAVFDGHAGREAADWCGQNFHQVSPKLMAPCYISHVSLVLVFAPDSPSQSRNYHTRCIQSDVPQSRQKPIKNFRGLSGQDTFRLHCCHRLSSHRRCSRASILPQDSA